MIQTHFQHINLTDDQKIALDKFEKFLSSDSSIFVLKGYAGSGKTTILSGIVEYLTDSKKKSLLMAPTGRAAKVINTKTKKEATTIHKGIYSFEVLNDIRAKNEKGDEELESFMYYFKLRSGIDLQNSVIIVDEASMLSNHENNGEFFRFGTGFLLNDLISFSRIKEPQLNTKILFVGDPAQLPPVGMNFSPALDEEYLRKEFQLKVESVYLREVKRQDSNSAILSAASNIRKSLTSGYFNNFDLKENGRDIYNPEFASFIDTYEKIENNKIIITYKNKTALDINKQIRIRKWGSEVPPQTGDTIIVGANNYRKGVMNGEFGILVQVGADTISRTISLRGKKPVLLTWRYVELLFPDKENNDNVVKGYILENYLIGDTYLKPEETQALYVDFVNRNKGLKKGTSEFDQAIMDDLFFNAYMIKYGYAVTCHKAQGGEWESAFVTWDYGVNDDKDYKTVKHDSKGKKNEGFYRWAYTAITRASNKLFCINPPYFNSYSSMTFISKEVADAYQTLSGNKIETEEIEIDSLLNEEMNKLKIYNEPIFLQDLFIRLLYTVRPLYIDIINRKKAQYQETFIFSREKDLCGITFWYNGKQEWTKIQRSSNNAGTDEFFETIVKLIESSKKITVKRNTVETILSKIEFDQKLEEEKPFLNNLFIDLTEQVRISDINIDEIEHQQNHERYYFKRNSEIAVIDFYYKDDGFFTSIYPVQSKCNSIRLLEEVQNIITKLTATNHVV